MIIVVFDVGGTLPNTDLSRDFMGLVVDGSLGLGTDYSEFRPHRFAHNENDFA